MKENLKRWNETTPIHAKSKDYDLENFLRGKNSLHTIELEGLKDIKGKSLLHLQCQFGMDTLSWARLGASKVVGVDYSDTAINLAKSINDKLKLPAEFICSNIYDLTKKLNEKFDIVFTSYGVLCWLPDIEEWAKIISYFLKKGGIFFITEFHPFTWIFDDEHPSELVYKYPYFFGKNPLHYSSAYTYTEQEKELVNIDSYNWQHTMGEIITALTVEGLSIEYMKEYPYTFYPQFPFMEKSGKDIWKFQDDKYNIPLIFSIKAKKN